MFRNVPWLGSSRQWDPRQLRAPGPGLVPPGSWHEAGGHPQGSSHCPAGPPGGCLQVLKGHMASPLSPTMFHPHMSCLASQCSREGAGGGQGCCLVGEACPAGRCRLEALPQGA